MLTFSYALLAVVIAQSLTTLAKNSPTPHDLEVARRELEEFNTPVAFRPKESDIIYVKDTALDVWIIDLDDSFLLGKGAQGFVRRAWKATVGVPPAEAPQYVVKRLLNVDDSEKIGEQPYTTEVDVLKALNRAPSHALVSKKGTSVTNGTVHSEYKSCKSIHSIKTWGSRCNSAAEAFIFQLLIPGTQTGKLKIYYNPEAIANVQEGMRRELKNLHRLGWVHADVHADNFLATETDTPNQYSVTIIDFGKAHEITDIDKSTNVKGDFLLVDKFRIDLKTMQFDWPWNKYDLESESFEDLGNYFEKHFGHVEDWRIKFDRLRELEIAAFNVPRYDRGEKKKFFESLPYYESLFKQTMSQVTALVFDSRAARLLKDFKLAKDSFKTADLKLTSKSDAESRANKAIEDLSLKIKRLEDIVADEVVAKREEAEEAKREEAKRMEARREEAKAKREEAKREEAKREEAKHEEAKREEAKREEAKREEAKREEAKREEAKREEAKREEAKREEAKREEAKREAQTGPDHGQASPHMDNSGTSFSFSLRETMSVSAAAGLIYVALAVAM